MADVKIQDLLATTTVADNDLFIVEDNADTKKMTGANLKTAILGNRTYTEQNVVTNGESITNSINKLDVVAGLIGLGGIIDSGSNTNGSYIRFIDGTQICYGSVVVGSSVPNPWVSMFATGDIGFTFARPFLESPICNLTFVRHQTSNSAWAILQTLSTTGGSGAMITAQQSLTYGWLQFLATGRWK